MTRWPALALALVASGCCFKCTEDGVIDDLRGPRRRSADGGTTLTVVEASPGCVLLLDGKPFAPLHVTKSVKPGPHVLSCRDGETMDIDVPAGFDVTFDYWGP